jgi:hypothetical protein
MAATESSDPTVVLVVLEARGFEPRHVELPAGAIALRLINQSPYHPARLVLERNEGETASIVYQDTDDSRDRRSWLRQTLSAGTYHLRLATAPDISVELTVTSPVQ